MATTVDDLVGEISSKLQEVEDLLEEGERTKICVPRRVVRPVHRIEPDYLFIANRTTRKNICYAVEALDFYRWLINRFNLYGPVSGYLYKTGVVLVYMIVEAMIKDFLRQRSIQPCKKRSKRNIDKLEKEGIPPTVCDRVRKLHEMRACIHLDRVKQLEATRYDLKDWNRSIICLRRLREALRNASTQ